MRTTAFLTTDDGDDLEVRAEVTMDFTYDAFGRVPLGLLIEDVEARLFGSQEPWVALTEDEITEEMYDALARAFGED